MLYISTRNKNEHYTANRALMEDRTADGGYFLPDDGEKGYRELSAFVRTLRSRAVNTLRTLKAANKALQRMDGAQVEMMEGFCEPNERDTDQ